MAKRGLFFVIEGIDGSGTSTHIHRLTERIEEIDKYQDVLRTHEPWKNKEIKTKLQQDRDAYSDPLEMTDLYIDDRAKHTYRLIRPNLEAGAIILNSRYKMSTCSYQWAQGIPLFKLLEMHEHRGILTPDLTFFLDIPIEVSDERIRNRGQPQEKFEGNPEFVDRLTSAYKALVHMSEVDPRIFGRVVRIDGNREIEDVAEDIFSEFKIFYNSWISKS
jgi:dTMP kinase